MSTTNGRDSVSGTGYLFRSFAGIVGAQVFATSGPDGAAPVDGTASTSPSVIYVHVQDQGPVTCLRVVGNRAAVGYLGTPNFDAPPDHQPVPFMIYIQDNGPTGDNLSWSQLDAPATSCPDPSTVDMSSFGTLTSGDFTVHDAGT